MKRYLSVIGLFALGFFLVGIGWGIWTHKKQAEELARSQPLRILCAENWLSTETLERFSRMHNVRIQQWTYNRPTEFLRQMANADANVDVVCTSSVLVKSLAHSHWLKKIDVNSLANMKQVAVDFSHLPFDQNAEYVVPIFWNLYGFLSRGDKTLPPSWKQIWQSKKIALWGQELNVLELMNRLGLNVGQRMEEEENSRAGKSLDEEFQRFINSGTDYLQPSNELKADELLQKSEFAEVPLARVAKILADVSDYHFLLPVDGATVEVGVLAVGEKSSRPELALELINELIGPSEALAIHERLHAGVLNSSLSGLSTLLPFEKPEALRQFPLNRLRFPDLNVDELPYFEHIYDETMN